MIATVFAAVYYAEVVAHRAEEPFGTLILALAVTAIEVALSVSVMLASAAARPNWHVALYGAFVFVQTVRHRDHFLIPGDEEAPPNHPRKHRSA